ncbi:MAG: ATP-binding cassette domain-containing protein [Deltaproteobacteria bacterium]|jgi:ABC transport system ATP-binding/permease protein|nr:ATP-binding cassette domain-containing protein [Deltaproteobacteria bacterium]
MAILSLQNISLALGGPLILDKVNLQIEQSERICLVGRNGAGKSTLINLINNGIQPDSGDIFRKPGLALGTLSQEVPPQIQGKIIDVVSSGLKDILSKDSQYAWGIQAHVEKIITRLKLAPDTEFRTLSAGMKRRVLLAKTIAEGLDLLLLDEPTNHMDIPSIELMENFLLQYPKALLFVSHDRVFLEKLATRIIEIDRGRLTSWACDYRTYLERRSALIESEEEHNRQFDKKLSKEEIWIRKGIKARRTRDEGRVHALMKMREEKRARREQTGKVRMAAQEADRSGKIVLEAKNVTYHYDDHPIIKAFSTTILRGDKVGVMGPNGCGKTTLIQVLLKELEPFEGHIRLGARVECAYFDQTREQLDPEKTVIENVTGGGDFLIINGKSRHAVGYLKEFLFTPDQMRSPVKTLSGGERNRLLLARLFMKPSNLLVLDEPTNDLDAETLELLEELLLNYQGNVLLVSHDRAFLNNLVTSIFVFEGNGRITEYIGGYDDWLKQRKKNKTEIPSKPGKSCTKKPKPKPEGRKKLTFRENRELEDIPSLIESLEQEHAVLFGRMSDPAFYKNEGGEIAYAKERLQSLEIELEKTYKRWETLDALKEIYDD